MNFKIILIILIAIVLLNIFVFFNSYHREGYENGTVKFEDDVDDDGEQEYAKVNKLGEYKGTKYNLEKAYGRMPNIEDAISTCAEYANNDNYSFFGLQNPQHGKKKGHPLCFATNNYDNAIILGENENYVGKVKKYRKFKRWIVKKLWKRCWKKKRGKLRKAWCAIRKIKKVTRRRLVSSFIINSDDFGTHSANTVYEIDKSELVYDEAQSIIDEIQGNRNYVGDWELVFGRLENNTIHQENDWLSLLNKNRFNEGSTTSITKDNIGNIHYGIIWRRCENCVGQMRDIFYKRLTPWNMTNEEIKSLFNGTWNSSKNKFNVDYQLYSTYSDALNQNKPWEYCSDLDAAGGFPGTCGPKGSVQDQSRSLDSTDDENVDWSFLIEVVDPSNMGNFNT